MMVGESNVDLGRHVVPRLDNCIGPLERSTYLLEYICLLVIVFLVCGCVAVGIPEAVPFSGITHSIIAL